MASCSSRGPLDQAADAPPAPGWPRTVDEAVEVLKTQWFTPENLAWIRDNPKNYVMSQLHFPFGVDVRREFGLWGENVALLTSCGDDFAEACSDIIFDALWESVQNDSLTAE